MRYHDIAEALVTGPQILPEDITYCPNNHPLERNHIQIYLWNVIGPHSRQRVIAQKKMKTLVVLNHTDGI
jgi:hypothetical protein